MDEQKYSYVLNGKLYFGYFTWIDKICFENKYNIKLYPQDEDNEEDN